jgi:hypothetical protein
MIRSAPKRTGSTVEQLRADIDSGRTHDKVANADPAVAPLGTDDEAAGTRLDPRAVSRDRRMTASSRAQVENANQNARRPLLFTLVILGIAFVIFAVMYGLVASEMVTRLRFPQ